MRGDLPAVRGSLRARDADVELVSMPVAQRWLDQHGPAARAWLDQARDVARSWARRWHLEVGGPLPGGSVSIVLSVERAPGPASVRAGGPAPGPAVLKLAAPWSRWSRAEAAALRAWDGHGAVRLLAASVDARALLLERVRPGTHATDMAPADIAAVLGKLSRPAIPPGIPSLTDALRLRFERARENRHGMLSAAQLARARRDAMDCAAMSPQPPVPQTLGHQTLGHQTLVLCHGDLMSKNVLVSDDRGLLAIDPNPCAGYPAYDAALWALTEDPVADAPERAAALAAVLGVPVDDILRWVGLLAAGEACMASLARAEASLELARRLGAEWSRQAP